MAKQSSLPRVIGWYWPADRRTDYTGELVDRHTGEVYRPPSMTKQEFVRECDINNIVKEYLISGQITHINAKASQGAFMDLPGDLDFQSAMNTVLRGQQAFSELPSGVRDRFGNDPEAFLAFCSDPANLDEMQKLGLANKPSEPPAPAAPPAAPPGEPSGRPGAAPLPSPPPGQGPL